MKLIFAIVRADNEDEVTVALNTAGYEVTRLSTQGGFLRRGNATLMTVTADEKVDKAIDIIKKECGERQKIRVDVPFTSGTGFIGHTVMPTQVEVGGATIFTVDVERFEHL